MTHEEVDMLLHECAVSGGWLRVHIHREQRSGRYHHPFVMLVSIRQVNSYPRYRPYKKATNCFAPRIRFLTFSSATPACRSCCSNRLNASFNSLLNSFSITRSSTLGIASSPIDKLSLLRSALACTI